MTPRDYPTRIRLVEPVQPPIDYEELERRIKKADNIDRWNRAHPQLQRRLNGAPRHITVGPARAARGGLLPDLLSLRRALVTAAVVLVFTYALLTAALVLL